MNRETSGRCASRAIVGLACSLLLACQSTAQRTSKVTPRDATDYAAHVQPYLEYSCATLDCHGNPGRALRLYSELGLRAQDALRTKPITAQSDPIAITTDELTANVLAFAGVALEAKTPSQHLALLKPLAPGAGGVQHAGGVHFRSLKDPGYQCLRAWLVGDMASDLGQLCASALDAVKPPDM